MQLTAAGEDGTYGAHAAPLVVLASGVGIACVTALSPARVDTNALAKAPPTRFVLTTSVNLFTC